jgi:hypothetical protein
VVGAQRLIERGAGTQRLVGDEHVERDELLTVLSIGWLDHGGFDAVLHASAHGEGKSEG